MSGIWVVLKKDLSEYWVLPLVLIMLPLLVFYLPFYGQGGQLTVGIYGNPTVQTPFELKEITEIEQGIRQVERGELDAFYVPEQKLLYGSEREKEKMELILDFFSEPTNQIRETSIENSLEIRHLSLPLLCVLSLLMTGFIGAPIAILHEKEGRTLQALLLTPLTYQEFIIEKAIFGFVISFFSSIVFLLLTEIIGNIIGIMIVLLLSSFLISLVAVAFGLLFSNMETMIGFLTPLLLLVIFAEVFSSFNNYYLPLPISRALYKLMIMGEIPLREGFLIITLSVLILILDSYWLRKAFQGKNILT